MKYATSVCMNMILAPISIGGFIYYCSQWMVKDSGSNKVSLARILWSVCSGIIILFIEMVLFIIRNDRMDVTIEKKRVRRNVICFGYDRKKKDIPFNG